MDTIIDKGIVGGIVGGSLIVMMYLYQYLISKGKSTAVAILGTTLFMGLGMSIIAVIYDLLSNPGSPEYVVIVLVLLVAAIGIYYFLGDIWSPLNTNVINLKNIKFITLVGAVVASGMTIAFRDNQRALHLVIFQDGLWLSNELIQIILVFVPYVLVRVWEASYRK